MSKNLLVINCDIRETRVALIENGIIAEFHIERANQEKCLGDVVLGKVSRVLPGMQAAFIDVGLDKAAFLHVEDLIRPDDFEGYLTGRRKTERAEDDEAPSEEDVPAKAAEARPERAQRNDRHDGGGQRHEQRGDRDKRDRGDRNDRGDREKREPSAIAASAPVAPRPTESTPSSLEPAAPSATVAASPESPPAASTDPSATPEPTPSAPPGRRRRQRLDTAKTALLPPVPPLDAPTPPQAVPPATASGIVVPPPPASVVVATPEAPPALPSATFAQPAVVVAPPPAPPSSLVVAVPPLPAPTMVDLPVSLPETLSPVQELAREAAFDKPARHENAPEGGAPVDGNVGEEGDEDDDLGLGDDEGVKTTEGEAGQDPSRRSRRSRRRRRGRKDEGKGEAAVAQAPKPPPPPPQQPQQAQRQHRGDRHEHRDRNDREGRGDRGGRRGGSENSHVTHGHSHGRIDKHTPIREVVREGQEVLVQITKEPIGTKGARVSSHVSLPGRYVVYLPTVEYVGVSKRIGSEKERQRLREAIDSMRPPSGGLIVRTVAEGLTKKQLKQDVGYLVRLWGEIAKKKEGAKGASLLYKELDLVLKVARDMFTDDIEQIVIDDRNQYERLVRFVEMFMPERVKDVLFYQGDEPIFDAYGIEEEISRSLARKVPLPSGGYLIIDEAEALTAIDVNTGRFVGKGSKDHEDTIVKTNMEAVQEIAYQLRFRNLGGLIVLDLIDMERASSREAVRRRLEDLLQKDKAKTSLNRISDLGLIEMTRKRTSESLGRVLHEPCFYCDGTGQISSKTTVVYEILRAIRRDRANLPGYTVIVNAHPEVVSLMKGEERQAVQECEKRFLRKIELTPRKEYHLEQFDLLGR